MLSVGVGECVFSSGDYVGWSVRNFIVDSEVHLKKSASFQTCNIIPVLLVSTEEGPKIKKNLMR